MNKEMIISSSGHETMAAILEDDEVVEISVERDKSRGVVGNIYKGRVKKILPGMQCAFVDLGLERDGFLYVSDVIDPVDSLDGVDTSDTDGDTDTPAAGNGGHGSGNGSDRGRGRECEPRLWLVGCSDADRYKQGHNGHGPHMIVLRARIGLRGEGGGSMATLEFFAAITRAWRVAWRLRVDLAHGASSRH